MTIQQTLNQRGKVYGSFRGNAEKMQTLKEFARQTPGWAAMSPAQREGIDMILHKIGRILNGDPNYADNWHDIAGYASLVEQDIERGYAAAVPDAERLHSLLQQGKLEPVPSEADGRAQQKTGTYKRAAYE